MIKKQINLLFAFSLLLFLLIFHKEKQIKQIKTNFKNNKIKQRKKTENKTKCWKKED